MSDEIYVELTPDAEVSVEIGTDAELNFWPEGALDDYYTIQEVDQKLLQKANESELAGKANRSELSGYLKPGDLLDLIYPIGAIYISVSSASPGSLFGGTWVQIKDKFLLCAGDTYAAGSAAGEATHTLTESELPELTGEISAGNGSDGQSGGGYGAFRSASGVFSVPETDRQYARATDATSTAWGGSVYGKAKFSMSIGGGQPHNNMPPYLAVYVWRRSA